MKSKTTAAWLAFVGGPLGLHCFYLRGFSSLLGWLLPIPTALGLYGLERVRLYGSDGNMLKRGDVLRIETGGGGGYGHPFDRPTDKVLEDVLGGFVSVDAARRLYGVAIGAGAVDRTDTARLRTNRPATGAFAR